MEKINLNRGWKLHDSPLCWEKEKLAEVKLYQDGWLTCDIPTDVRMPLIEKGRPLSGVGVGGKACMVVFERV